MRNKLACILIAFCLCACYFQQTRQFATGNKNNVSMFVNQMSIIEPELIPHYKPCWDMRIASRLMSQKVFEGYSPKKPMQEWTFQDWEQYKDGFGFWQAFWLAAVFALIIFTISEPLIVILLIFAGVSCAKMTPEMVPSILCWDMTTLFAWTAVSLLWLKGRYWLMVPAIIFGTFIGKETVAISGILFFFAGLGWRRSLAMLLLAALGCVAVRLALTKAMLGHYALNTVCNRGDLWVNFKHLMAYNFSDQLRGCFLTLNAGLVVICIFWPATDRFALAVKAVTLLFLCGITLSTAGDGLYFYEAREWTDLLPLQALFLQTRLKR